MPEKYATKKELESLAIANVFAFGFILVLIGYALKNYIYMAVSLGPFAGAIMRYFRVYRKMK